MQELADRLHSISYQLRAQPSRQAEVLESSLVRVECAYSTAIEFDLTGLSLPTGVLAKLRRAIILLRDLIDRSREATTIFSLCDVDSTGGPGRPRFVISTSVLESMIELGFSVVSIANILGVSRSTICRRLKEAGMSASQKYCCISNSDLDDVVRSISVTFPNCGYKMMMGHLKERGITVQQFRVRESVRRVDPEGTSLRFRSTLKRRQYNVMFPLELWHIDGNHKLIRWRFVVHGGIDGFSRIPVYLKCSTNNRAETVKDYFVEAVQEYGLPLRIRCDMGGENVHVAQFMWSQPNRSQDWGTVLMGKSVHNQRIERLWKDVYSGCLFLYHQLFRYLEDCGLLNPCSELHLLALHYIFLPRIQDSLDHFRQAYIQHPISSARNQTPGQLWAAGLIRGIEENRRWADELYQENPSLYGVDLDGLCPLDAEDDVIVPEVTILNKEECLEALQQTVHPLHPSVNYGIDLYCLAVDTVVRIAQ